MLEIAIESCEDAHLRGFVGILIADVFRFYRGALAALDSGKPVPVSEFRQLGACDLARVLVVLARNQPGPGVDLMTTLSTLVSHCASYEFEEAHADGRRAERRHRREAIERALRGALATFELDEVRA